MELSRTSKNMFDWVRVVVAPVKTAELEVEDYGNDKWMEEHLRKEERLLMMKERKEKWEIGHVCRGIVEEIMVKVARSEIEKKMVDIVIDSAIQELLILLYHRLCICFDYKNSDNEI